MTEHRAELTDRGSECTYVSVAVQQEEACCHGRYCVPLVPLAPIQISTVIILILSDCSGGHGGHVHGRRRSPSIDIVVVQASSFRGLRTRANTRAFVLSKT